MTYFVMVIIILKLKKSRNSKISKNQKIQKIKKFKKSKNSKNPNKFCIKLYGKKAFSPSYYVLKSLNPSSKFSVLPMILLDFHIPQRIARLI